MKVGKKILTICSLGILLSSASCMAVTNTDINYSDNKEICYKLYQVKEDEKDSFISNIENEIELNGEKYKLKKYDFTGGNTEKTIDISTSRTATLKTNNINEIVNQLGENLEYNENGYIGTYTIDRASIELKKNYNGYYEKIIDKTMNYEGLSRNDLDFIPKEIEVSGRKMNLLKTEWIPESYTNIGNAKVEDKYTAKCYYATKERVDNPYTYTVTANYVGTAKKIEEHPIDFKLEYEKVEKPVIEEEKEEQKDSNILPVVSGTGGIILVIIFFLTENVMVYNFRDGEWIRVGKTRMYGNKIKLDKFALFERTNRYKIELSKALTQKKNGELIEINKKGKSVKVMVAGGENIPYRFEVRL